MARDSNLPPESEFLLELAAPARSALTAAGYTTLAHLAILTEADVLKLHGMGPKSLPTLRRALAANGLSFAGAESETPAPQSSVRSGTR